MTSKKNEDHLAGVLALAADEQKSSEGCIAAEDFALMLEVKLDASERQRFLEHLAHCDICYNQWKLLKEPIISGNKRNIIPIIAPKLYRYVGSTLAIAATIAVFLNVYEFPRPDMILLDNDSVTKEELSLGEAEIQMDSRENISDALVDEPMEQKGASPAVSKSMQKSKSRGKAERINKKLYAPAPVPAKMAENVLSQSREVHVKPSSETVAREQGMDLQGAEFSNKVIEGCSQNTYNASYWKDIAVLGERIAAELSSMELLEKEKIVQITELTANMDAANWKSRCEEIRHLLAEEIRSR